MQRLRVTAQLNCKARIKEDGWISWSIHSIASFLCAWWDTFGIYGLEITEAPSLGSWYLEHSSVDSQCCFTHMLLLWTRSQFPQLPSPLPPPLRLECSLFKPISHFHEIKHSSMFWKSLCHWGHMWGEVCLGGCLPRGCTPPPLWTDRHLWKHNNCCGRWQFSFSVLVNSNFSS